MSDLWFKVWMSSLTTEDTKYVTLKYADGGSM